jgi:hypothetical protein
MALRKQQNYALFKLEKPAKLSIYLSITLAIEMSHTQDAVFCPGGLRNIAFLIFNCFYPIAVFECSVFK